MHVLLDARTILGPMTGDRTYWLGLLSALPDVAPHHHFTAALTEPPPAGLLPERPNLDCVIEPSPGGRLWTAVALPRLARDLGVDLVHLQYVGPPWLSCPFVTTVHDCSFELFPRTFARKDRFWLRTLVPYTVRRAAAVVGVSETTRQDLLRLYGLRPDRVFAAPNGISPAYRRATSDEVHRVRAAYNLPAEYLLSVGVLQPRKNLPGLISAYAAARRQHGVEMPLVVAGKKGWLYDDIFRLVDSLGVGDHVRFIGYVPDAYLVPLYSGATLMLYPSLYEGFGLPPLEAMACGTAAVVSDTPALVEVTGEAAPHLPANDADAWAGAVARLLSDDTERARLSELGPPQAARFTWERSAEAHLAAYAYAVEGVAAPEA